MRRRQRGQRDAGHAEAVLRHDPLSIDAHRALVALLSETAGRAAARC